MADPWKCAKVKKCPYYKQCKLLNRYMPTIIQEALTSAVNSGIIETKVERILKRIRDEAINSSD
jgi:hypothetical protein